MITLVNNKVNLPIMCFNNINLNDRFDNNPFYRCLIFAYESKVVGYLSFLYMYDKVEIEDFLVLEEYRNKGIGKELMEFLLGYSKDNNIKNITLEVRDNNAIAIKLYEKYGFTKKAIRENYYGNIDGILMEKEMI